jgi:hypothetical protein
VLIALTRWPHWFNTFKLTVYLLLTANIGFFFIEELEGARDLLQSTFDLALLLELFPATIDTAAWVLLLLMFELETYQLDDAALTPKVEKLLMLIRIICVSFIVTAFVGYLLTLLTLFEAESIAIGQLCEMSASGYSQMVDQDAFMSLTAQDCQSLMTSASGPLIAHDELRWFALMKDFEAVQWLAWVDVGNAAVWILVVALLELDLQLSGSPYDSEQWRAISRVFKVLAYTALVLFAVYWGFAGSFLDFEDAFLWIVAFVFIERNVVIWDKEREKTQSSGVTE